MRNAAALALFLLAADSAIAQARDGLIRGGGPGFVPRAPRPGVRTTIPMGEYDPANERKPRPKNAPIPLPPADKQWLRVETPHFVIFSAFGERASRQVASDLEELTAYLVRLSGFYVTPGQRTRVFLFRERTTAQPYFDALGGGAVDASGMTVPHPRGSTMFIDARSRGGGVLTPRHELVHDLLRSNEPHFPLWLNEGLAEYYSNLGQPIREHASRVRVRVPIPVDQLFRMTFTAQKAWTFDFYAESWAAVFVLMRRDASVFYDFVRDINQGIDPVLALRENYRMTTSELEQLIRKSGTPAAALPLPPVAVSIDITPMHYADLLYELGETLSGVAGKTDDAERHLRAAVEASPGNPSILLTYAEVLLAKPGCTAEARELAQRALDRDGDTPRALGIIALSHLAEGDKVAARAQLEPAIEAAPHREDLSYALFSLLIDAGERERADDLFTRLVSTQRANDARRILLKVDIARADTLARAGKVLEAAKILRDLAPKMPAKTRANLELQAAGLEAASQR